MRAVLTGLLGRRRQTNSPRESRQAAIPLACKLPKTHLSFGTKNQGPSKILSLSLPLDLFGPSVQTTSVRFPVLHLQAAMVLHLTRKTAQIP
jgi:hypothetical protein